MLPRLQSFFDPHLSALIADNLSTFVSDYDFPLALYVEGERVVYPSPVVMKQASAAYRRWLIDHGVNH